MTIPIEAAQPTDIPGSVVAVETIAPTTTSAVSVAQVTAKASGVVVDETDEAVESCSVVVKTVTVELPKPTSSETACSVVTSTVTVNAPLATVTSATLVESTVKFSNGTASATGVPAVRRLLR